ncbi:MAG: class I SAM-dependent methyltransferase [Arenimonas sp.]
MKPDIMTQCNICATPLGDPIFSSESDMALTSLCELQAGKVQVWSCQNCSHLLGNALQNTEQYYQSDYRILLAHDDEDQIYEMHNEQIVYRTDHQVSTLIEKLELPQNAMLLDYGCAKASTPKKLLSRRNDLQVHLFDVSDMYRSYWDQFVPNDRQTTHQTPAHWQKKFDIITSFFALEHIPDPQGTLKHIAELLNDDGVFYGIVPDTFGNVADFIVIDHVNHFTIPSLHELLTRHGFGKIDIDAVTHRGALVFTARKEGPSSERTNVGSAITQSIALAKYWTEIGSRIKASEPGKEPGPSAIYGSGFYGAYIFSTLKQPERVECFLDRSPYQQGKALFGKAILAPENLPAGTKTLFVGLNPAIARDVMASMSWPNCPDLKLVFLDGVTS